MNQNKDDDSSANVPKEYSAEDVERLTDREHVRKRPGMYIGDTQKCGLHYLIEEILAMMLNCHRAGVVSRISIEAHLDQSITIRDNNISCQLEIDKRLSESEQREVTNLEVELAHLCRSQGLDFFGADSSCDGGLVGTSVAVVTFLSSCLKIQACGKSQVFRHSYLQGNPEGAVEITPRTNEVGTQITFTPDPEIFSEKHRNFDGEIMRKRLEMCSYLNAGLETNFIDQRTGNEFTYRFSNGIREFLNRPPTHPNPILVNAQDGDIHFEAAFESTHDVVSYVNTRRSFEGGTHVTHFFRVLAEVLNERNLYCLEYNALPHAKDYELQLRGIISLRISEPHWKGSTKTRLGNLVLEEFADKHIKQQLVDFFDGQPELARSIIWKAVVAANARTGE